MPGRPHVHISLIHPHPSNIRKQFRGIEEMAASIRAAGILDALLLEPHPTLRGHYQIVDGERRYRAAKLARQDQIPAHTLPIVQDARRATVLMLIKNCQRDQLTPAEKASAFGQLRDADWSQAQISKATGFSPSTISECLSLLELDESSRDRVSNGSVPRAQAVAAVRKVRRSRRGGPTGRPVVASPPWLNRRHPLADQARAACTHSDRPLVGNVACGQCWEQVIRDDEHRPGRLERSVENYADLRAQGCSREEAARELGVGVGTTWRYDAELARAAASWRHQAQLAGAVTAETAAARNPHAGAQAHPAAVLQSVS